MHSQIKQGRVPTVSRKWRCNTTTATERGHHEHQITRSHAAIRATIASRLARNECSALRTGKRADSRTAVTADKGAGRVVSDDRAVRRENTNARGNRATASVTGTAAPGADGGNEDAPGKTAQRPKLASSAISYCHSWRSASAAAGGNTISERFRRLGLFTSNPAFRYVFSSCRGSKCLGLGKFRPIFREVVRPQVLAGDLLLKAQLNEVAATGWNVTLTSLPLISGRRLDAGNRGKFCQPPSQANGTHNSLISFHAPIIRYYLAKTQGIAKNICKLPNYS